MLPSGNKAKFIELAKAGKIRAEKGKIVHVGGLSFCLCRNLHFLRSPTPFPAGQNLPTPLNAKSLERLRLRPSFEGWVEPSANYVLVDDVVSMGGTLAELANFIQLNSGKVLGSIVLVNAGRDKAFNPKKKDIRLLEERFNEEIKKIFGIHVSALTANEASYLVGFRTTDEIRNRYAKAEKETNLRLLSKGFS